MLIVIKCFILKLSFSDVKNILYKLTFDQQKRWCFMAYEISFQISLKYCSIAMIIFYVPKTIK